MIAQMASIGTESEDVVRKDVDAILSTTTILFMYQDTSPCSASSHMKASLKQCRPRSRHVTFSSVCFSEQEEEARRHRRRRSRHRSALAHVLA